jgi:hypothetical protein
MNPNNASSVGCPTPVKTKAADQISRMLEDIKLHSIELSKRAGEALCGVTSTGPAAENCEKEVCKQMELPPLFNEYRSQLIVIKNNLWDISRTLDRLEL